MSKLAGHALFPKRPQITSRLKALGFYSALLLLAATASWSVLPHGGEAIDAAAVAGGAGLVLVQHRLRARLDRVTQQLSANPQRQQLRASADESGVRAKWLHRGLHEPSTHRSTTPKKSWHDRLQLLLTACAVATVSWWVWAHAGRWQVAWILLVAWLLLLQQTLELRRRLLGMERVLQRRLVRRLMSDLVERAAEKASHTPPPPT